MGIKMKNKIFISLLIVSFFNYMGCYSYYTLSNEEIKDGKPEPTQVIKLLLKNGSEFECVPISQYKDNSLFYLKVDTAGTYLLGQGEVYNLSTRITSKFNGVIREDMIDSSRIDTISSIERFSVWSKNNEWFIFKSGNYSIITPEQGIGYFIWSPNDSVRKVSFNDVKEIQEDDISWSKTTLLIFLSFAAIAGLALLSINESLKWDK